MAFRTVNGLFFILLLMYHKITIGIMTATDKHASKLAEIENQLADSELYSAENKEKLTALLAQQVEVKKALEEVEMDWLAAQEELEAMLQA